ncbi:CDP-diacylglycerol-serine O-phosphatidyltransferase [Agyrium rufum]|nr:CDP-diacylglycerol-serine O-phosphatidyltransferase [Agyrium rufum]
MSLRPGMDKKDGADAPNGAATKSSEDKQKVLLAENAGHFSMIKALHLADLITEMNGFCGFMSILSSMKYCLGSPDNLTNMWLALGFMPFGLFFDFMDGKVARWRKKSSLMGQELDSLADLDRMEVEENSKDGGFVGPEKWSWQKGAYYSGVTGETNHDLEFLGDVEKKFDKKSLANHTCFPPQVSFGVSPAAASFALGLRTPLDQLILTFFVLCGLTRLARFNVTVSTLPKDATGKSKYFEGFPIPTSLAIVTVMAVYVGQGRIHESIVGGVLAKGMLWEVHPIAAVFGVWGCMMVSRSIHIPKL